MASTAATEAVAETVTAETTEVVEEGPVLSLISKRIRALKKKLNRITQMEETVSKGKPLNKEQEEVFRSKPSVVASIDELEKLRAPLTVAVVEEIRLATPPENCPNNKNLKTTGRRNELEKLRAPLAVAVAHEIRLATPPEVKEEDQCDSVEGLLDLLYFSSMFDVRNQEDFSSLMLTKNHERESCLSYDYVTEEDTDMLSRGDLDLISQLGGLLISRPVNSSLSHKNALQLCIEHAKQWLANSDHPISPDANITYAGLKAKLNKIMALNYFTVTPKMKATVEMAAAAGNYGSFQEPEQHSVVHTEGSEDHYQEVDTANFHRAESYENLAIPAEEPQKAEFGSETSIEVASNKELEEPQPKEDQNHTVVEKREQPVAPRRNYQNQRSGAYTGGNGRRGYPNSRRGGGRGGGPYQNGGYYDQPSDNFQQNYRYNRERGGRGGVRNYQNYVPKAQVSGHVPADS